MKRLLTTLAATLLTWSALQAQTSDLAGYLFAYFQGNGTSQEHLFYAISSDGLNYTPLNGGTAVVDFTSIAVKKNIRDPFITRAEDGTWLMVSTDMRSSEGWSSNRGIVMSKSTDLVNWTHSTVNFPTKYAGTTFANVTRVWAPEVIYDRLARRYMVYFSILTNDGTYSYDKVVYCYANDSFTDLDGEPTHLFDRGSATIDMTIVYNDADHKYHAFYKNENAGGIGHAWASRLTALGTQATGSQWTVTNSSVQQTTQAVEGPSVFKRISDGRWILGYDCYAASPAFFQMCEVADDFSSFTWWGDCPNHGAFMPRHGSIIPLTSEELYNLDMALGGADELAALKAELGDELTRAEALGVDTSAEQAVLASATANRLELQEAIDSLKEKEYQQVMADYPYDALSLLGSPANVNIASNSGQHWDGSSSSVYYEQPGTSWSASAWTSSMTYRAQLPQGEYVFRVACRASSGVTATISGNGQAEVIPTNGDVGLGINLGGETSFSVDDEFANGGKGRGWEWRFIPVTVTDADGQDVTFTITASASTAHQWFSVTSIGLRSKQEVETTASEKNPTQTATQVRAAVNITSAVDYKVTSTTPFTTTGSVNIANDNAVLILAGVKPSEVISSWLTFVKINGAAAVSGENCQVKMYGSGAIIMPHGDAFQPLTCYSEQNYKGQSCNDYTTGSNNGYMRSLGQSQLQNGIRSFRLKRGYMVTFATGTDGWGYSRCFIADDRDLELGVLPTVLDGKISSYRLFKWNDAQKKGIASTSDAASIAAVNASWSYTWGVGSDSYPDTEFVPHKIHKNWPGVADCGKAEFSAHMKTDNEPANPADDQPATVGEVLNYWQDAMRTGMRLLAPSSHDGGYAWQEEFMNAIDSRGWRCDILDMHCYWAAGSFSSLQNYYNKFGRPIWISELLWGASWNSNGIFAAVSDPSSNSSSNQTANYNGGKPILDQLNGYPYVERYAWWNGENVCSRIYTGGELTKLGTYYAGMESGIGFSHDYEFVPVVVIANPYELRVQTSGNSVSMTWMDSNGDMMDAIQVQYRRPEDSSWQVLATIDRQDKTGKGDQSYTYEGVLADAGDYIYRVVDIYEGQEFPTATSDFVGMGVDYNGETYYLGGNAIPNGDFSYGFSGWTDGTGNASPAKAKLEVVPVAGPDNGAYLRSYGHTSVDADASLKGSFTVARNQPYQFSVWHKDHDGGWQKASLSADGATESEEVSNLSNVSDWAKESATFTSGSYSRFIIKYRWLNSTAKFDKFALRRLFASEQEAYEDGFTYVQAEAEVFKAWNAGYADINVELDARLSAAGSMAHNSVESAKERYEAAATALSEARHGMATKKSLDSLLIVAQRVEDDAHPLVSLLQSAISQASEANTVGGYEAALKNLRATLDRYLSLEEVTALVKNPTFATDDGWTTKAGSYTGGDQRTNNIWGKTCWNAWWSTSDGGTLEVRQTLTDLPAGYYMMSCVATTQPFCVTDQHGYITNGTTTESTPVLTFERFDAPGITNADVWEPLATLPVWVGEGGSLTIGFQSSKQNQQSANPVYSDHREGWWCATDFRLFRYNIPQFLLGDVNRDGDVTIADVTALVNILLGKADAENGEWRMENADVSQDGEVSVADVVALVNIILGRK